MARLRPSTYLRIALKGLGVLLIYYAVQLAVSFQAFEAAALTVFPYLTVFAIAALIVAGVLALLS